MRAHAGRVVALAIALFTPIFSVISPMRAAETNAPMRVVVRTTSDLDREIAKRVLGQAADLDVAIAQVATPSLEKRMVDQLATADALASARAARVVVWFDVEPGVVLVYVSEPASGRLLLRRLNDPAPSPTSATLESAALIVRSALAALSEGGSIGVERSTLVPSASALVVSTAPTASATTVPPTDAAPVRSSLAIGWQGVLDGTSDVGVHAALLQGALAWRRLEVRLGGTFGISSFDDETYLRVALSRQTAFGFTGLRFGGRAFEAVVGARIGVEIFSRSTDAEAPGVQTTPSHRNASALFGLELGGRWRIGGPMALLFGAGVDATPAAPKVQFVVDGEPRDARSPWVVTPRVFAALEILSGG